MLPEGLHEIHLAHWIQSHQEGSRASLRWWDQAINSLDPGFPDTQLHAFMEARPFRYARLYRGVAGCLLVFSPYYSSTAVVLHVGSRYCEDQLMVHY